jgi:hypothetical protein
MQDRGYAPVLLQARSKRPVDTCWQMGVKRVAERLRIDPEKNLGWRMGLQPNGKRLLAIDDDGGLEELKKVLGDPGATWRQQTPSWGVHLVFSVPADVELSNRVRVAGHAVDVRCDGGFIVIAPSELDTGPYRLLDRGPIRELLPRWLACLRAVPAPPPVPLPDHLTPSLERALAYTAQCEPAISGQGGHQATFRVALKCVEFGLSIMDTLVVLREYNGRCDPPWSEKELVHKCEQAHGVGRVQRGGKLAARAARARGF